VDNREYFVKSNMGRVDDVEVLNFFNIPICYVLERFLVKG
jgi:hypothetical protein